MVRKAVMTGLLASLCVATPVSATLDCYDAGADSQRPAGLASNWVILTWDDQATIYLDVASIRPVGPAMTGRNFPVVQASVKYVFRNVVYGHVGSEPLRDRVDLESVDCNAQRRATLSYAEHALLDGSPRRSESRADYALYYRSPQPASVGERVYRVICGLDALGQ